MSISAAPAATARLVSATFTSSDDRPLGNAVATDATNTCEPTRAATAGPARPRDTQTAQTGGDDGSLGGRRRALARDALTLPGAAAPSTLVRSDLRPASDTA